MKFVYTLLFFFISFHTFSQSSVIICPTDQQAFNSVVSFPYATVSSASNPVDMVAAYWTGGGSPGAWRSFFKMDLSAIPPGVIVDSAYFTFYADNTSAWGNPGSPNFGIDNGAYVCRITSPYTFNTINWNSEPSYTYTNAAVLPQSVSTTQDYIHIEATHLIQDIIASTNHGFALVLQNEINTYNSQIFYSSACPIETKRPSLKVYYHIATGINAVNADISFSTNVSEIQNNILIHCSDLFSGKVEVYNLSGGKMYSSIIKIERLISIQKNNFAQGIYFIKLMNEKQQKTIELVID